MSSKIPFKPTKDRLLVCLDVETIRKNVKNSPIILFEEDRLGVKPYVVLKTGPKVRSKIYCGDTVLLPDNYYFEVHHDNVTYRIYKEEHAIAKVLSLDDYPLYVSSEGGKVEMFCYGAQGC